MGLCLGEEEGAEGIEEAGEEGGLGVEGGEDPLQEVAEGPRADEGEGEEEGGEVEGIDEGIGEEAAVFADIGLSDSEEFEGVGDMEGPGEADEEEGGEGDRGLGVWGSDPAEEEPEEEGEDGIEGEEVGGEGDPDIIFGYADGAAAAGDVQAGGASTEEEGPEGMGEFVAEDVGFGDRGEEAPGEDPEEDTGEGGGDAGTWEAGGGFDEDDAGAPEGIGQGGARGEEAEAEDELEAFHWGLFFREGG